MSEKTRLLVPFKEETNIQGFITPNYQHSPIPIEGIVTLGRDLANDIVVFDPHVSLFHCQFEKRPKGFYIRDLKSSNGVYVNEAKVNEAQLVEGTQIRIGKLEYLFYQKKEGSDRPLPISSKNTFWKAQISRLPNIAKSQLPVFIQGESGTGKEVVAKIIHDLSPRRDGPFVAVNCSALAESLVESELFGHIKGSFTGAMTDRKGAFESARGGTLFLDEIGDLPLSLQPKLLRALEQHEIKPVGSDKSIQTDVRIVTATHKHLKSLVDNGQFREDLFFRINVVHFYIPPLRDRVEDFEDLLYLFAREYRISFTFPAIQILKRQSWSGNVRELKNTIARAKALFPGGVVSAEDLALLFEGAPPPPPDPDKKFRTARIDTPEARESEKERIIAALRTFGGNQRKTALHLSMPKSTLHDRIKSYGINPKSLLDMKGPVENSQNTPLGENLVEGGSNVNFQS